MNTGMSVNSFSTFSNYEINPITIMDYRSIIQLSSLKVAVTCVLLFFTTTTDCGEGLASYPGTGGLSMKLLCKPTRTDIDSAKLGKSVVLVLARGLSNAKGLT